MADKPLLHFEISERKVLLRIFDVLFVLLTLTLLQSFTNFSYFRISKEFWYWTVLLVVYLKLFAHVFELYDLQKASHFDIVLKNVLLTTSVTVLFFILTPLLSPSLPDNRIQILYFFLTILCTLLLWRWAYISLIASPRFNKRVIVVGDSFDIQMIAEAFKKADPNYEVVGFVNTDEQVEVEDENFLRFEVDNLRKSVEEYHIKEIVVSSGYKGGLMLPLYNELSFLLNEGFPIRDYMQVYEDITARIPVQNVDHDFYRYFPFSRSNQNKFYLFSLRLFDILFSLMGIFIGLVLTPFVLLGNALANRGPLFYTQERIGQNSKTFKIVKFRTMVKNAEEQGPRYAEKNDLRTTPFGKFMRKARIDEIPQFLNLLKGEMSLIGPRPERPVFVQELSKSIPFYNIRHVIKPGLTGWAQVKGDYSGEEAGALEKLQYDLFYIKHRSIFLDLNIILKTLSTVISMRGQ
ncbi:exopolysaccharide biosynthesis polyprenyl glycosylphosphotransferase [Zunongwangia endophytica]|uniref:Exopolysaccharide biosynthesis polyprenyl glycosylphosphotransferase n=1 Tax=Zunongwangia endophytica TaxID=1808945 RepID=A0ABV8H5Z3_9FLAO|nr:exopolysaccharide biosynthesis polyprenyl glycosylphosphotransferase [Zunongwangia endophytica]MDN3595020.1 exopolysaccharide biosynthesis polyprenyl glycosylphosphotransferase [Zunongwangia endophytica]